MTIPLIVIGAAGFAFKLWLLFNGEGKSNDEGDEGHFSGWG